MPKRKCQCNPEQPDSCKLCHKRVSYREWRKNNPEKFNETQRRYAESHRKERAANSARWRANNPDKARETQDRGKHRAAIRRRERLYGHTEDLIRQLWAEQKGGCATCQKPLLFQQKGFQADHCHVTGKPRGLLCLRCNVMLGVLEDPRAQVLQAYRAEWAERHASAQMPEAAE